MRAAHSERLVIGSIDIDDTSLKSVPFRWVWSHTGDAHAQHTSPLLERADVVFPLVGTSYLWRYLLWSLLVITEKSLIIFDPRVS